MRVFHVFDLGEIGGLFRVVEGLSVAQHKAGVEVAVVPVLGAGDADHPLLMRIHAAGVSVHPVRLPGRAYLGERRLIGRMLRDLRADVLHTHGYRSDVVDGPAGERAGVATVSTSHGFIGGGLKNRVYERLQVRAQRRLDAVVAVSKPLADRLRREGVPSDRLHVIPNAFVPAGDPLPRSEARKELGIIEDGFHVGWVGRVSPEKGPDVLVDAMRLLRDRPIAATIIGDGRLRSRLQSRSRDLPIRWAGAVDEAWRLFAGFDALVLSSRTEGTPIVLLEAMHARVPIVATTVGGVPDVVRSTEAVLVASEAPVRLAEGIESIRLQTGPARARVMSAYRRLQDYSPDGWVRSYTSVYEAAIGGREGRPG